MMMLEDSHVLRINVMNMKTFQNGTFGVKNFENFFINRPGSQRTRDRHTNCHDLSRKQTGRFALLCMEK